MTDIGRRESVLIPRLPIIPKDLSSQFKRISCINPAQNHIPPGSGAARGRFSSPASVRCSRKSNPDLQVGVRKQPMYDATQSIMKSLLNAEMMKVRMRRKVKIILKERS
ncbi:hypothetical protein AVEN_52611-1 [Araneus ventricosus]|uniref:Uncharacterized protein n=1 Tax=Araneus ventricosus TaxID=182803 RepID=A0A4Y2ERN1_ARAVE|nr:hypothetical protein AVEN_52611-1 [Araneus ventricosus]